MAWCLIPKQAEKFISKLKSGEINPTELANMTSAERREFFNQFGEENAKNINALFESKLLLKNQKAGMITWAKNISGISKAAKRDIISRINRLENVLSPSAEARFLEDLASKKLNVDITREEAKNIFDLAKKTEDTLGKIPEGSPIRSTERMEYGASKVLFEEYLLQLKKGDPSAVAWVMEYIKNPGKIITGLAGTFKSLLVTLDNSFFGRQGIKVLLTSPDIWAKNFAKSFVDIGRELGKGLFKADAMDVIKADMFSRPNAINGKYDLAKLDIHGITEEVFPTSIPEKVPLLGRFFKASESAFSGGALRMRADLADRYIKQMSSQGINTLDKTQMVGMGKLVNSMTGRGKISLTPGQSRTVNVLFFSIRFVKSNMDTLFGGTLNLAKYPFARKSMTFAQKKSATNLLKIVAGISTTLTMAEMLHPGSVDADPRSANFGKIKIGNTRFDVTGGMSSLAILASRIMWTRHDGEWGFWRKSSVSGKFTNLAAGKYGQDNVIDVLFQTLFLNKLSPLFGAARDVFQGEHFGGEEITPTSTLRNLTVPISIQELRELLEDPKSAPVLQSIILEMLGISVSNYSGK